MKFPKIFPLSLKVEYELLTDINKYNDILIKYPFNQIRNHEIGKSDELLNNEKILEIFLNLYFSYLLFFIVKNSLNSVIGFPEILPNLSSARKFNW